MLTLSSVVVETLQQHLSDCTITVAESVSIVRVRVVDAKKDWQSDYQFDRWGLKRAAHRPEQTASLMADIFNESYRKHHAVTT